MGELKFRKYGSAPIENTKAKIKCPYCGEALLVLATDDACEKYEETFFGCETDDQRNVLKACSIAMEHELACKAMWKVIKNHKCKQSTE